MHQISLKINQPCSNRLRIQIIPQLYTIKKIREALGYFGMPGVSFCNRWHILLQNMIFNRHGISMKIDGIQQGKSSKHVPYIVQMHYGTIGRSLLIGSSI